VVYKLLVRPLAANEIVDATDWYNEQKEDLGNEFIDELDGFFNNLLLNPFVYSYYDKPVRQGKINRFPYIVVYEIFGELIVIYSVFMAKQNPSKKRKS